MPATSNPAANDMRPLPMGGGNPDRTRGRIIVTGDTKVIEHLNRCLGNELVAINQYFLHARMYKNWGLKELAEYEYRESNDEMKHAAALRERNLFQEGFPNLH